MKTLKYLLVTGLFIGMAACGPDKKSEQDETINGDKPATSLSSEKIEAIESAVFTDFDGNKYTLEDFRGKTILIDFWETWCAPCLSLMPTLDRLMAEYSDDFVVLATSPLWTDSESDVRRFIDSHDYGFYYVHANELANQLSIRGIPYKVYIHPDGTFYKDESGSRGPEREYTQMSQLIEQLRES